MLGARFFRRSRLATLGALLAVSLSVGAWLAVALTAAEASDPQFSSGHIIHHHNEYDAFGVFMEATVRISYLENRGAGGMVTAWVERVQGQPEAQRVFWMEAGERVELEAAYSFPVPSAGTQVRFNVRAAQPGDTDIESDGVTFNVIRLPGFPAYPAPVPTATPPPTATPSPTPVPTPTPVPISSGQRVSGSIDAPMDKDRWTFYGSQGQLVTIRMDRAPGTSLKPYLELFAPDGNSEAFAFPDVETDSYALIDNWRLRTSGVYVIVARSFMSTMGAYALSLTVSPPLPTPTPNPAYKPIASGQTLSGNIISMGSRDGWAFYGNQSHRVTIRVEKGPGSSLEPYVELIEPYASLETSAFYDRAKGYALIDSWSLRSTGTYVIRISGFMVTTGAYTLSLVVTPSGAAPATTPVPTLVPSPTAAPTPPPTMTPVLNPTATPSAGLAVANQLASASQRLILVLTWDADDPNDPWKLYDPKAPEWANDLSAMERGHGYWINVDATSTLSYGGRSYPLAPGWNLVGWQG